VTTCSSNKYASGNICYSCNPECATCSGPLNNNCKSCNSPNFLNQLMCIAVCPAGTFGSLTPPECLKCHATCTTCNGINNNNCLSCPSNIYLDGSVCVADCGIRKYKNVDRCSLCYATCETCSGGGQNQCLKCVSGKFLTKTFYCVDAASCDSKTYADTSKFKDLYLYQ
jgi:proprotein convertase subtilisin/kexin type 5